MPVKTAWDAFLDPAGRWFLSSIDYRIWGLLALVVAAGFSFWRRYRLEAWPSRNDYLKLVFAIIGVIGGVTTMVVFLLTKPPAVDLLPSPTLLLLGLGIPILVFGESIPTLKALFFPKPAPEPPPEARANVPTNPAERPAAHSAGVERRQG